MKDEFGYFAKKEILPNIKCLKSISLFVSTWMILNSIETQLRKALRMNQYP
jgi:hypothetical protein